MKNIRHIFLSCILASVLVCYFEPANATGGNTYLICNSGTNAPVFPNPATSGQTIRAISLKPVASAIITAIPVGSVVAGTPKVASVVEGNLQFPIDVVEGNLQFPIDVVEGNLQFPIDILQNPNYFASAAIKDNGGLYSAGLTLPSDLDDGNYVITVTTTDGATFSGCIWVNHN